jgi:hypothetical protein
MLSLQGARVLIIEPDILLAVHLTYELVQHGAEVPVVAPTLPRVVRAVAEDGYDAVVVDPRLDEGDITPALLPLLTDDVPLLVTSLLPAALLPEPLAVCSFVRKPYDLAATVSGLAEVIAGRTIIRSRPTM